MFLREKGVFMSNYTVLIIDDEYEQRRSTYERFFAQKYTEADTVFIIISVEDKSQFNNLCKNWQHVDAIFLDAKLDDAWNIHDAYFYVLQQIEKLYTKKRTPPVFMVSKNWKDQKDNLLTEVSEKLSKLKKFGPPSAYYDFSVLEGIVDDANVFLNNYSNDNLKLRLLSLSNHRQLVIDEIEKHQAMEKVDAVIILAVADEKNMTYKVFNLNDENDKELTGNGLVYQKSTINDYKIAFVTQNCMGLSEAARVAESAILTFEPKVLIMGGVCAGDKERVSMGTIVIPRHIYEYSSGKIITGKDGQPEFSQRLINVSASKKMSRFYQYVESDTNIRNIIAGIQNAFIGTVPKQVEKATIVTYPLASGPWVIDSEKVFTVIKNKIPHDKFCSIDMEAFAFASVAQIHDLPWLVVKTVQDYANGKKRTNEKQSRQYATFSSAQFIKSHLAKIIEYSHPDEE